MLRQRGGEQDTAELNPVPTFIEIRHLGKRTKCSGNSESEYFSLENAGEKVMKVFLH